MLPCAVIRSLQPVLPRPSRSSRTPAPPNPFFSHSSALLSRVRIHLIPQDLRFLSFQSLTHSFAVPNSLSPIFSAVSALFPQKPGSGWLYLALPSSCSASPSFPARCQLSSVSSQLPSISFRFIFFADPSLLNPLESHSSKKQGGRGCATRAPIFTAPALFPGPETVPLLLCSGFN